MFSAGNATENEARAPRRAVAVNVDSGPGGRRRGARQRLHAAMVPEDSGMVQLSLCLLSCEYLKLKFRKYPAIHTN